MGNYTIKAKKIIEEYLKENKISKSRFCQICKISRITLDKILVGERKMTSGSALKIAHICNIPFSELYENYYYVHQKCEVVNKSLIFDYMKNNNLYLCTFCRLCKIPVREFKHLFDYRHSVNNDTFYKMAQTMEVEVEELFVGIEEDCLKLIKNLQLGLKVDFSKIQTLSKIQNKSLKLPNSDI